MLNRFCHVSAGMLTLLLEVSKERIACAVRTLIEDPVDSTLQATARLRYALPDRQGAEACRIVVSAHSRISDHLHRVVPRHTFTAIPIVARSSVEALADLLCLQKDPAHINSMDLRARSQDYNLWNDKVALQTDPIQKGLKHPTAAEDIDWIKTIKEAVEGATYRLKGVFKDADLEEIYAVHYNRLSVHAHNNNQSLYERHVGPDPATGSKRSVYLKYSTQGTLLGLGVAAASLEGAITITAQIFNKVDLLPSTKGA